MACPGSMRIFGPMPKFTALQSLLSEDFQHGRMYGTVTIRNPFLALSAST